MYLPPAHSLTEELASAFTAAMKAAKRKHIQYTPGEEARTDDENRLHTHLSGVTKHQHSGRKPKSPKKKKTDDSLPAIGGGGGGGGGGGDGIQTGSGARARKSAQSELNDDEGPIEYFDEHGKTLKSDELERAAAATKMAAAMRGRKGRQTFTVTKAKVEKERIDAARAEAEAVKAEASGGGGGRRRPRARPRTRR